MAKTSDDKQIEAMDQAIAELQTAKKDGLYNPMTGMGSYTHDLRSYNVWKNCRKNVSQYETLYAASDIAKSIVDIPVDEALKNGYEIVSGPDGTESWAHSVGLSEKISEALKYSRVTGGSCVWLMSADSLQSDPLEDSAEVTGLRVFDSTEVRVVDVDKEPTSPRFGDAIMFEIGKADNAKQIHYTRMVCFIHERPPRKNREDAEHWGMSSLHRVFDIITDFTGVWNSTMHSAQRGNMLVFKLAAMMKKMTDNGGALGRKRMQMLNIQASEFRTLVMDSEEHVEFLSNQASSLMPVVEQSMSRISAASGIPSTKLWGKSPDGMNATGKGDLENFYSMVSSVQERDIKPAIERILSAGMKSAVEIQFPPLWELSLVDKMAARKTQAEVDALYINHLVNTPEQIARSRFTEEGYSHEYSGVTIKDIAAMSGDDLFEDEPPKDNGDA